MLGDDPAEAVKAGDAMPLGILRGEAARIPIGLAFAVASWPTRAEDEARDVGAAIGGAELGVGPQVANEEIPGTPGNSGTL
jgi:hypothetical protein